MTDLSSPQSFFRHVLGWVIVLWILTVWRRDSDGRFSRGGLRRRLRQPIASRRHIDSGNNLRGALLGQRRLQEQQVYPVQLHLALIYVPEEVAVHLETKDPANPVVSHFCKSVNFQASGSQATDAAAKLNATFVTKIIPNISNPSTPDYECDILATNRAYDNDAQDLYGSSHFILEITAKQLLHVNMVNSSDTDENVTLSLQDVTSAVETGYSRGTGGRVKFRHLLRTMVAYQTVFDIKVLDALSPPHAAPSQPPSTMPNFLPSAAPSSLPTSAPSDAPSSTPSLEPTAEPSFSSTLVTASPTMAPTLDNTTLPSTVLPTLPTAVDDDDNDSERRPLILGAIAGGVATILVSCFFIFCIYFPFCKGGSSSRASFDDFSYTSSSAFKGRVSVNNSRLCSSPHPPTGRLGDDDDDDDGESLPEHIPGMVSVGVENASLAETTLGDHTSHRKRKKTASTEDETLPILDSFDDSLYTNESVHDTHLRGRYTQTMNGTTVEELSIVPLSSGVLLHPSSLLGEEEDGVFRHVAASNEELGGRASSKSPPRHEPLAVMNEKGANNEDEKSDASIADKEANSGQSNIPFAPPIVSVESDEDRAKEVSNSMDRDGYDPFGEDTSGSSSFEFDNVEKLGNGIDPYGSPPEVPDDRSSPSSASSQQKHIERLILSALPQKDELDRLVGPPKEEKREEGEDRNEVGESNTIGRDIQSPPRQTQDTVGSQSSKAHINNSLLRSVLEDARLLSEGKSLSNRSRLSQKSAPSRISKNATRMRPERQRPKISDDLLADHLDLEAQFANAKKPLRYHSSKSVGGLPRKRDNRDKEERVVPKRPGRVTSASKDVVPFSKTSKGAQDGSFSDEDKRLPYRTRFLDRVAVVKPHHYVPPSTDSHAKTTKSAVVSAPIKNIDSDRSVGAQLGERGPATPMSTDSSVLSPSGKLGAQPRSEDSNWNVDSDGSVIHEPSDVDTPASSPGVLGIVSQAGASSILSGPGSASDSDGLSNPWLFDAVEQTLGPRSAAADMDSISGRSSRSGRSNNSRKSHVSNSSKKKGTKGKSSKSTLRPSESPNSRQSRSSRKSNQSAARATPNGAGEYSSRNIAMLTNSGVMDAEEKNEAGEDPPMVPRSLDQALERLQMQLADALQTEMDQITTSSFTAISTESSVQRRKAAKKSQKKRMVVVVPPGKLGVVLANRHDGQGTVISEVRPSSALKDTLKPGDKVVAVDGEDVTKMLVKDITALMGSRSHAERRLTVITTSPRRGETSRVAQSEEAKVEEHT